MIFASLSLYKFKRGFVMPIILIFNLRRNVPYFYDTFGIKKSTPVAELHVIPDAPWWSAALTHTIAWCIPTPQPSIEHAGVIPTSWAIPLTLGFGAILLGGE